MIRRLLGRFPSPTKNKFVDEWIVPVDQPMIWLNQMARCGGTMTLRLFDGHPEFHVHPRPMKIRWPQNPTRQNVDRVFNHFSLQKYHLTGWQKAASNNFQSLVPVYFDQDWYRSIFSKFRPENGRDLINAASTARFNAWRNYQSLYGDKKFQLLHTTIWSHLNTERIYNNFFKSNPDGYSVFILRSPDDWIASLMKLEQTNRPKKITKTEDCIEEYIKILNAYLHSKSSSNSDRMICLEFNKFISDPENTILSLSELIGFSKHPCFESTTTNGLLLQANSSHVKSDKGAPDPSVIGKGAELREELKKNPLFAEANELFRKASDQSIN